MKRYRKILGLYAYISDEDLEKVRTIIKENGLTEQDEVAEILDEMGIGFSYNYDCLPAGKRSIK